MSNDDAIACTEGAPARARRVVAAALAAWSIDVVADDVVLCTSEAVTNVVRYGAEPARLRVTWAPPTLRVEVHDSGPGLPAPGRLDDPAAPSGRGLAMIDVIAESWGVTPRQEGGKAVWFTFTVPPLTPTTRCPVGWLCRS